MHPQTSLMKLSKMSEKNDHIKMKQIKKLTIKVREDASKASVAALCIWTYDDLYIINHIDTRLEQDETWVAVYETIKSIARSAKASHRTS